MKCLLWGCQDNLCDFLLLMEINQYISSWTINLQNKITLPSNLSYINSTKVYNKTYRTNLLTITTKEKRHFFTLNRKYGLFLLQSDHRADHGSADCNWTMLHVVDDDGVRLQHQAGTLDVLWQGQCAYFFFPYRPWWWQYLEYARWFVFLNVFMT